jgi:hypothetical protein
MGNTGQERCDTMEGRTWEDNEEEEELWKKEISGEAWLPHTKKVKTP